MSKENLRCLIINENDDLIDFGSNNNHRLRFHFLAENFKKCEEFRFLEKFNIHFYKADSISSIIIGVERYGECKVIEFDEIKYVMRVFYQTKNFYNNSQLKLLRKDKIGNFLLEIGDDEYDSEN